MAIKVKPEHLEAISKHGEETYPYECCGFLIGEKDGEMNILRMVYRAENEWTKTTERESQANRYLITPEQSRRAVILAREHYLGIIDFYIIVAVEKVRASVFNSFMKPDYELFVQEEIVIEE